MTIWLLTVVPVVTFGQIERLNDEYRIQVSLDTATHTLTAKTTLTWTNPDEKPVDHMLFHMYYNAFKNTNSTFFSENEFPESLRPPQDDGCHWSYTDITDIKDNNGNDLTTMISYIQPDDTNILDQSVLRLDLITAVNPGESITLSFDWNAAIPNIMPRTGYNKEYYFFAQWFPKLGVYETAGMRYAEEGSWNCHQYHANGEYYSDFANYNVSMTVPNSYVVASSGWLQAKHTFDSQMTTWTFTCDNIIDFTWATSPHFTVQKDKFKDTDILFYTYPYKEDIASRYFTAIKYCMHYLDEKLGDYPYPTLSIVDPPIHGLFTGGMEYPTLVTSISFNFFPQGFRTPETLVMHEFIHQYFMQMVATHEVEEAWMDEGFTTYWEGRILDDFLGESCSMVDFAGFNIGTKEYNRFEFLNSEYNTSAPITDKSYEFESSAYGPISYNKTALWLQTLERMIGVELMDEIWKTYFQRWKYKHPCRQDFIDVVNELVQLKCQKFPDGMDWYFDQVIYGTDLCDYAITNISNDVITTQAGFIDGDIDCLNSIETDSIKSTITIRKIENITVPQQLKVYFKNGNILTEELFATNEYTEVSYTTDSEITKAIIDPDTLIYIDRNLLNNSYTTEKLSQKTNNTMTSWLQGRFQNALEFLSLLI